MGKAKWLTILGVIVIGVSLGYFFMSRFDGDSENLEKKIDLASRDYFEKYISVNETTSIYKITLNMLYSSGEDYELSGLEDCNKDETYSEVFVNFKTGTPKEVNVKLSC